MRKIALVLLVLVVLEASFIMEADAWRRWFRGRRIWRYARTGLTVARMFGRKRDPEPNSDVSKTNFEYYDANNDGYIDTDEYKAALRDHPVADMSHFKVLDTNNDGRLHHSEIRDSLLRALRRDEMPELDLDEDDLEYLEDEE